MRLLNEKRARVSENRNTIFGILLFVAVISLCVFLTALVDSKAGEVAGALGNVIGGTIGALGAALAVYLTLTLQRDDETQKVGRAIVMEVAHLSKFPSGQLDNCVLIASGRFSDCPRAKLASMMNTPQPVVYPSVAGQISRHPKSELIVAFYTGLQETRSMVEIITEAQHRGPLLKRKDVEGLGILLREQCRLAREIIRHESAQPTSHLARESLRLLGVMLDGAVRKGDAAFPTVAEFEARTDPANI